MVLFYVMPMNHAMHFLRNEWGMATSWKLRDLCGSYRTYVALAGRLPHTPRNSHVDLVIAIDTFHSTSQKSPYGSYRMVVWKGVTTAFS